MADEEKKSGWLSKLFWGAVKVATIGVIAAVAWQVFLDPLFFPIFHDTSNIIAQAWMHKVNSGFGWIPQHAGLAHEPGLLTGFMKWFLGDEISNYTLPTQSVADPNVSDGLDILSGLTPAFGH